MSSICRSRLRWRSAAGVVGTGWVAVAMTLARRARLYFQCTGCLLPCVIARAHQGARLHMPVAQFEPDSAQLGELLRRVPPRHRQVVLGRPQVLTERQDVDILGPQI